MKHPSANLIASVVDGYADNHDLWRFFHRIGFQWAGLRIRDGYTLDDFVIMATMLTEGAALRHRFEPEALWRPGRHNLHIEALVALVDRLTEPVDADDEEELTPPD